MDAPPPKKPKFVASPREDNKSGGQIAADEIDQLKAELAKKDKEMDEMMGTFTELKKYVDQLESQKGTLNQQIETSKAQMDLKNSQLGAIEIKDSQISMLNESLKLKDTQIQALKDSLSMKDQQMNTLQDALKLKDDQLNQLKMTSASSEEVAATQVQLKEKQKLIDEKNAQIEDLKKEVVSSKKEIDLLNQDLEAADKLGEDLQKQMKEGGAGGAIDLEKIRYSREQIVAKVIDILNRAIHNVTIVTPSIEDLDDLKLFEIKSSVSLKVACNIDTANSKHSDLLAEFESLDNISIRQYDAKDRWGISRDNEEVFLGALGEGSNLVFYSRDPLHLKLFNPIIMESWLRSRKL